MRTEIIDTFRLSTGGSNIDWFSNVVDCCLRDGHCPRRGIVLRCWSDWFAATSAWRMPLFFFLFFPKCMLSSRMVPSSRCSHADISV